MELALEFSHAAQTNHGSIARQSALARHGARRGSGRPTRNQHPKSD
jgi:hypothetical protein